MDKKTALLKKGIAAARKNELKAKYKQHILQKQLTKDVANYLQKLDDDPNVVAGSRIDDYWARHTISLIAHNYFDKGKVKKHGRNVSDSATTVKRFSLRGIQYGNWLSQEDRYNYLFAISISLYDMKELLNLPFNKMGFKNKLTLAFGARGRGGALAHFEPGNFAINLTRYPHSMTNPFTNQTKKFLKGDNSKYNAMLSMGGVGSFSHEWAHALDYELGKPGQYLSGGRSTRYKVNSKLINQKTAAGTMERILKIVNCNEDGSKSAYRAKLEAQIKNSSAGDYYIRRTEIFARLFEAFCSTELAKKGGKNIFISKPKYLHWAYPSKNLIAKAAPEIRSLLAFYRRY